MSKINIKCKKIHQHLHIIDFLSSFLHRSYRLCFFLVVNVHNWEWLRNAVLHENANACISLTMQESAAVYSRKQSMAGYIPLLYLHTIPIFRNCKLQNISSVQFNLKYLFNAIISFLHSTINIFSLYFIL